jgi:peroxiredoxin
MTHEIGHMSTSPEAELQTAFERCRDMDGPINERLAAYATALRLINPDFAEAVDRLIVRLRANDCGESAPGVGDVMPDFALPDDSGHIVRLDELLSKGPTAIMFHRGHWCPYCRINLAAIAKHGDDILKLGGQIVAVTPERQEFAAVFRSDAGSPFPVLSDLDNGYALSLNLAIWVGREMEKMMAERGRALPDYQGNNGWMLPIPATFVVGQDGRIRARFVDPDYRTRMDLDQLIEAFRR